MNIISDLLTEIPAKKELYANDIYFRESLDDLKKLWPTDLDPYLSRRCSIIIKPEAFASRKAWECITFLREKWFTPVGFKPFRFNRNLIRDLWRFQLNSATMERLKILDMWWDSSDVILAILRYDGINNLISASTKLTFVKWHSNPIHHKEWELRAALGQSIIMLNYLHSSDETADFIRDIWVCFDSEYRLDILKQMFRDEDVSVNIIEKIENIYTKTPYYNVSYDQALSDLQIQLDNLSSSGSIDLTTEQFNILPLVRGGLKRLLLWEKINVLDFFSCLQ